MTGDEFKAFLVQAKYKSWRAAMKMKNKTNALKGFITPGEHIQRLKKVRPNIYNILKSPDPRISLAWNVSELRNKAGYTQIELAEKSGVAPRTIQNVENLNSHFSPKLDVITAIAKGLDVNIIDLLRPVDLTHAFQK
jgi:DNA-binding XRE family transcriptional regulator